ncbi:MbtH family protein [Amycolatopsis vancoresmycina]|uniref:MbtH family protein n=1 Tax=Amycolatopsis vancoresmycina TaxID=208444 RepID=UPI00052480FA|nr:MbtH family protein [Amycolatopsis vancoresmycina]
MTTNPFEDDEAQYVVLVNDEGQHSLWPAGAEVPAGWRSVREADTRKASLKYVESAWTDMRPSSLVARGEGAG